MKSSVSVNNDLVHKVLGKIMVAIPSPETIRLR